MSLGSLWTAVGLLTRLPVPTRPALRDLGLALAWFPVVGALLAVPLFALWWSAHDHLSAATLAATGVALWAVATGALHLDGVADSADAWSAAHGNPRRGLEVMRDSRIGAHGAVALVLVLLLKFAALAELFARELSGPELFATLLLCTTIARGGIAFALSRSRIVEGSSMARAFTSGRATGAGLVALLVIFVAALSCGWLLPELRLRIVVHLLVSSMLIGSALLAASRRFGGLSGDMCGAVIEATEVAGLFVWGLRV